MIVNSSINHQEAVNIHFINYLSEYKDQLYTTILISFVSVVVIKIIGKHGRTFALFWDLIQFT